MASKFETAISYDMSFMGHRLSKIWMARLPASFSILATPEAAINYIGSGSPSGGLPDHDQSIYSWRGTNLAFIRRFPKDFPKAVQIKLDENFRSTSHILGAANAVISYDRERIGKTLFTKRESGDPIEVVRFRDAEDEARSIAAFRRRYSGE